MVPPVCTGSADNPSPSLSQDINIDRVSNTVHHTYSIAHLHEAILPTDVQICARGAVTRLRDKIMTLSQLNCERKKLNLNFFMPWTSFALFFFI